MIATLENILFDALVAAHGDGKTVTVDETLLKKATIKETGMTIEFYPDDIDTFTFRSPSSSLLIHYAGAEFSKPEGEDVIRQVMVPMFRVVIISRNLRNNDGIYSVLDANRSSVLQKENKEQLFYCIGEQLIATKNGVWWYAQDFAINQRVKA